MTKPPSRLNRILAIVGIIMVGVTGVCTGCSRPSQLLMANEELRLTPAQIAADEAAGQAGDAAAAKRLWHHYSFVTGEREKGKMWKARFESLSQASPTAP
jgi:hypothetical protein